MIRCTTCGESAEGLDRVLLNADGDFACSRKCADRYEKNMKMLADSLADNDAYAAWWAEGGIDIKQHGPDAWRTK